jgi:hypothetical protein
MRLNLRLGFEKDLNVGMYRDKKMWHGSFLVIAANYIISNKVWKKGG